MRRLASILLFLVVTAGLGLFALKLGIDRGLVGGKSTTSPDGKYELNLSRLINPDATDPYRISVRDVLSDELIVQMSYTPVAGLPTPPVRGPQTEIRWAADSTVAEIVFDDVVVCTIRVPE